MLTPPRVNLLPWRERARQRQRNRFLRWLAASVLAGLLLTGLASLWLGQKRQILHAKTQRLTAENTRLAETVKALPEARKQLDALRAHASELDRLSRQQALGLVLIDLLTRHMPSDAWLVSVKLTGNVAEIDAGAQNPLSAWHLARSLEQAAEVASIKLQHIQAQPAENAEKSVTGVGFRINLQLHSPKHSPSAPMAPSEREAS